MNDMTTQTATTWMSRARMKQLDLDRVDQPVSLDVAEPGIVLAREAVVLARDLRRAEGRQRIVLGGACPCVKGELELAIAHRVAEQDPDRLRL